MEKIDNVPTAAVMEASKGMLQKKLYAITTTPTDGLGPVFAGMEEHLAYQVKLEKDGLLYAAGPLFSEDGKTWSGEGFVVVRTVTLEDARAIAEDDPMHKSGARTYRLRPWMINEGRVSIRLDYSTQTFSLD
jgi:uncharacterized protein